MFTFVFISFHSEAHINSLVSGIEKKYPIIIVENSLNVDLKNELEKKYDNVKVIIPPKNNGISVGYNIAIKESKTNFVFLNPADIVLSDKCIEDLEECVSKIKDFAILAATYDDETVYKNYDIWNSEALTTNFSDETYKKYKIKEVDFIDNAFIINKSNFEDISFFDEKFFMYYETMDFCTRARRANKKIYVSDKIKFTHYGGQSTDLKKFSHEYSLSKSWHYCWSKFYYFKKNFGYFYALRKIFPNFLRSMKRMIICKLYRKDKELSIYKNEFLGIVNSILNKPSNYRPFE
jgi:GT2 family glycosyltransferase